MKKIALLLALFLFGIQGLFAQTRDITGSVTSSEDGAPIPGVSVMVKGTTVGTVTDVNGNFSLSIPAFAQTLSFSFVGMNSLDVPIGTQSEFKILMYPATFGVDEVVVTALGISRQKKSLGYAVQDIQSEEIVKAAPVNVISTLAGKVAGVQVNQAGGQIGASSRVVIRGNSSLGSNEPLVVVDGIPIANNSITANSVDYGSGLYDINPQDIESISILKGGAAAALYGMWAGHGVILITTKSGRGKARGVQISYEGNYNVDQVYSIQRYQNKYGQGYLGDEWYWKEAKAEGYTGSYQDFVLGGYDPGYGFAYVDGFGSGVNDGVDESWGPRLDIGLMIPQYNSPVVDGVRKATPWVSNPNNVRDLYQLGHSTNHNISLTSVTDNSNTRLSLGIRDQIGVLPNTDMTRYTAAINSTMKLSKLVEYNISMTYSRNESDNLPVTEYNASNPMQSLGQWTGRQIDMKDLKANWKTTMENGYPYNWNSNYHNNPFWSLNKNTNSFQKNRVFGKTSLFILPAKDLKIEARLGLDYYNSKNKPITTYRSNEMAAGYQAWDGGWFRLNSMASTEINADLIAYYDLVFGDLSINLLGGANYRNRRWDSQTLGADILTVPDLFTISNVSGSPVTAMDNDWVRSNSVYGAGSFGYNNFVFLDATVRNDWSSTIKDPIFYPSFSLSVLPLEATGLQSDILSYLKLRGGWAKVGSATGAYRTDPYFSAGLSTIYGITQYSQTTEFPPASLKPERVVTTELGLEANFLKNRIGLDVAVYDKTTTNQILSVQISKATGYNTSLVNAGELNNKGIEVQLRGDIFKSSHGFNWEMTLNWAKDKSEIVELYTDPITGQSLESYQIGSQWSTYVQARPGEPWGVIYGTGMLRRKSDNAIIVNAGGRPRTQANMILGNVTPDWLGGIRNAFSYKNFSAGFLVDLRKGGDIFSVSQMFGSYSGLLEHTALDDHRENGIILGKNFLKDEKFVKVVGKAAPDIQDSEFAENDIVTDAQTFFESYYGNRELSVYDGSYVKLREANLTYTLPKSIFGVSSFVKGGSISLVGTNLAILWRHKSNISGLDPENVVNSGNSGVGLESTTYPPSRSMGLKVNFSF